MTSQPDLFRPMCATTQATQGRLFDPDAPLPTGLSCRECGRTMLRTESGFLSCPMAHGRLIDEGATESADEPMPPLQWPQEARLIAKQHAARDNYLGFRWRCQCGACLRARLDGFQPREYRR